MHTFRNSILLIAFLFSVLLIGIFSMKFDSKKKVLKVAFPTNLPSTHYEPTSITVANEYTFLENVLSPLVEISKDGSIEPGIAEKAEWVNDELKLTIRSSLKTAFGKSITAEDVVFSLKRLLVLSQNTHGNFNDIVCPGLKLKSVNDDCPGIRKDENSVYLHAHGGKSFLLPMLAAIDFAIVPKFMTDPKTLAIKNFTETSGPYYVESDDEKGNIKLRINPNHYLSKEPIAETIVLIPFDPNKKSETLNALKNGDVDHLPIIDPARPDDMIPFAKEHSNFDIHVTAKIRTLALTFTERGHIDLSTGERRFIAQQIRLAFLTLFNNVPGFEQRLEFFPTQGAGGLTPEQRALAQQLIKQKLKKPQRKFKLGIFKRGDLAPWQKVINEFLPEAECYTDINIPELTNYKNIEDMPHAFIAATDTGFMEDIGLLSYTLNAGYLGLFKGDKDKWLADYMAIENKDTRIEKLKSLHFKAISEASNVPLITLPFTALVRKPWKMELSELYANNQFWRIKLP